MGSAHINDIFARVRRSILSSNSLLQLETAERLMQLFRRYHAYPELHEQLDALFIRKAGTMNYFEWKKNDREAA